MQIWIITLQLWLITHSRSKQTTADKKRSKLTRDRRTHALGECMKSAQTNNRVHTPVLTDNVVQKRTDARHICRAKLQPVMDGAVKTTQTRKNTHHLISARHDLHLIYVVSDFTARLSSAGDRLRVQAGCLGRFQTDQRVHTDVHFMDRCEV